MKLLKIILWPNKKTRVTMQNSQITRFFFWQQNNDNEQRVQLCEEATEKMGDASDKILRARTGLSKQRNGGGEGYSTSDRYAFVTRVVCIAIYIFIMS